MSKKTPSNSGNHHKQNTKTPDLTGFTTADKLPNFDEINEVKKRSTTSIYNSSTESAAEDPKRSTTLHKNNPKKRSTTSIYNSSTESAAEAPKRSTSKSEKDAKTKRSTTSIYNSSTESAAEAPKRSTSKSEKDAKTKKKYHIAQKQSKLPNTSKRSKNIQDLLNKYKTSTNQSNFEGSYLSIITLLKSGLRPSEIAAESGVPKTTLQHHLNALKKQGAIYKVGYGVWEVTDNPEITKKRSTTSIYVAKNTPPSEVRQNLHMFIPDSVRAHAFLFTLRVPRDLQNWTNEKREQYLDRHNIPYTHLNIAGGGQRLIVKGRKTHLTNRSIVIYDRSSYFAEKALEAKSNAVQSFISIIKNLERTLHVELTNGSDYKFKVSRQHYALVKNALAQQYNTEGQKLEVRSEADNSLWFLIDNSFNADEAEGVHPKTGMTDIAKVQDMFNSIKETGATMHTVLDMHHGLQQLYAGLQDLQATSIVDQAAFASDLRTHVDVQKVTASIQRETLTLLEQVGSGINDLATATRELTKAVKNNG